MRIRKLSEKDLVTILNWRNNLEIRKNMYNSKEISLQEHLAWFDGIKQDLTKCYLIYENKGVILGVIYFTQIDSVFKNASWGFYASPSAPIGTGARMEFFAIDYAFSTIGLYKLYCEVIEYNTAVIKLHQKFGFKQEGVFIEQVYKFDKFYDVYRFAIFSDDWFETNEYFKRILFKK